MAKKIDVGMVIAEKTAVIKPHVGGYPLARAEEEASDWGPCLLGDYVGRWTFLAHGPQVEKVKTQVKRWHITGGGRAYQEINLSNAASIFRYIS